MRAARRRHPHRFDSVTTRHCIVPHALRRAIIITNRERCIRQREGELSGAKLRIQRARYGEKRGETLYDKRELSCARTTAATAFRNVLGWVINGARGLLFYREARGLKKMVSFGGGRSAEFKRPSRKDPSFLGSGPIVLH